MIHKKCIAIARELAKELHRGQTDKAGKDYFAGHLCQVAEWGSNGMEKMVGYLHDAAEDTPYNADEVMQMLRQRCGKLLNDKDALLMYEALQALNHKTAASREEYIRRVCGNEIAARVKLNDLRHNMDVTRIENPAQKDFERIERYKKEFQQILSECQLLA